MAQGDSREVGLDAMLGNGFTITRAIRSRSWPASSANLEFAAVWGTLQSIPDELPRVADGIAVRGISALLEPVGRAEGMPVRLAENAGISFEGMKPYGQGFVVDVAEAQSWIAADRRNAEVLFPYLNGEDLNSRPDASASRWVIDFNDRSEPDAAKYELPFARVLQLVRPEREAKQKAVRDAAWWLFFRSRPALRRAIAELPEVLVIALVSKTVMPVRIRSAQVFSHALAVFATGSYSDQAVLSSSLHQLWAITYGSGMRNDPRYTPSDVFDTFPRPRPAALLDEIGRTLDTERREAMLRRDLGLTKLYNLVNNPSLSDSADPDVRRLREIHEELDREVIRAYGWDDLVVDHGFHEYRGMERWTVNPVVRAEILDRLLEENHRRAAAQTNDRALRRVAAPGQGETLFD